MSTKPGNRSMKHVSRACLECRSRHMKCGGQEPKCERCVKYSRECQYVKSNRGGSRRKGVKVVKQNTTKNDMLPCVKNHVGYLSERPNCTSQCLDIDQYNKAPPCLTKDKLKRQSKNEEIDYYPTFNSSNDKSALNIIFDLNNRKPLNECYISPVLTKDLDTDAIINTFYDNFYTAHPFLPPRENIKQYIDSIPLSTDLLLAMKMVGDGQTSHIYSKDIETVNFMVNSVVDYVKQIGPDFVSMQTLLMMSMVAHISSLHDLSTLIREAILTLVVDLDMNYLDESVLPEMFMDVNGNIFNYKKTASKKLNKLLENERVANVPSNILKDTIRRTFWELYFFDSISGTASGQYKSKIAVIKCFIMYPSSVTRDEFDFKSRAEACKLVNDAISLNVAIQRKTDYEVYFTHMNAALGNWEMKITNPSAYEMPLIVDVNGRVNEGLFESLVLLNYARIFTHRPFSYLWRSDVSKHPRCTTDVGIDEPCTEQDGDDRRKIIETRRTIDSANSFIKTILDTDASRITKRTPFIACGLAFSSLVHLSAYSWVDSNLKNEISKNGDFDANNKLLDISYDELNIYTEYIKLEMGSILQISKHWSLSTRLVQHIAETLIKVSPSLWTNALIGLPELKDLNIRVNSQNGSHDSESNSFETPENNELKVKTEGEQLVKSDSTVTHTNTEFSNPTNNSNNSTNFMSDYNELEINLLNNNANNASSMEESYGFPSTYLNPLSPSSDTGCDWVDKHVFEFDPMSLSMNLIDS